MRGAVEYTAAAAVGAVAALSVYRRCIQGFWYTRWARPTRDPAGKTILITGGLAGIGYEVARDFAVRGCRVVITGRGDPSRAAAVVADLEAAAAQSDHPRASVRYIHMDMASYGSVRRGFEEVVDTLVRSSGNGSPPTPTLPPAVDYVVLNAGIFRFDKNAATDAPTTCDGWEPTTHVNYLSHFLLMQLWKDAVGEGRLRAPERVVSVASGLHSRGSTGWFDGGACGTQEVQVRSGAQCYADSKLAQVIHMKEEARRGRDAATLWVSCTPGATWTSIFSKAPTVLAVLATPFLYAATRSAREGAQVVVHTLLAEDIDNGAYYSNCLPKAPLAVAEDERVGARLFEYSTRATRG